MQMGRVTSDQYVWHDVLLCRNIQSRPEWVGCVTSNRYAFHVPWCNIVQPGSGLSGWDVSKVTNMQEMFRDETALITTLQKILNVSSFFEGIYRDMPREKRRQAFAGAFAWQRSKAFMLFLVNHGYLYSASAPSNYKDPGATKPSSEMYGAV